MATNINRPHKNKTLKTSQPVSVIRLHEFKKRIQTYSVGPQLAHYSKQIHILSMLGAY